MGTWKPERKNRRRTVRQERPCSDLIHTARCRYVQTCRILQAGYFVRELLLSCLVKVPFIVAARWTGEVLEKAVRVPGTTYHVP